MEFVTHLCAQLLSLIEIVNKLHVNVNSIVIGNHNHRRMKGGGGAEGAKAPQYFLLNL